MSKSDKTPDSPVSCNMAGSENKTPDSPVSCNMAGGKNKTPDSPVSCNMIDRVARNKADSRYLNFTAPTEADTVEQSFTDAEITVMTETAADELSDLAYLTREKARRELARKSYKRYLYYVHGESWKRTKMSDFLADTLQRFVEEDTGNAYALPPAFLAGQLSQKESRKSSERIEN